MLQGADLVGPNRLPLRPDGPICQTAKAKFNNSMYVPEQNGAATQHGVAVRQHPFTTTPVASCWLACRSSLWNMRLPHVSLLNKGNTKPASGLIASRATRMHARFAGRPEHGHANAWSIKTSPDIPHPSKGPHPQAITGSGSHKRLRTATCMLCGGSNVMTSLGIAVSHVGRTGNAAKPGGEVQRRQPTARGCKSRSCECAMREVANHAATRQDLVRVVGGHLAGMQPLPRL